VFGAFFYDFGDKGLGIDDDQIPYKSEDKRCLGPIEDRNSDYDRRDHGDHHFAGSFVIHSKPSLFVFPA
jgi:hypothetical protein